MDVANGKIVCASSRSARSNSDLSSASKPSTRVLDGMAKPYPHGNTDQLVGSYHSLRGSMNWTGPSGFSSGALSPPSYTWGASTVASLGPGTRTSSSTLQEPGTGRWNRISGDNILGQPHKQSAASSFGPAHRGESLLLNSPSRFFPAIPWAADPQPGWKVSNSGAISERDVHSARSYTLSESRAAFDKEMNMFESQLCRAISGHLETPKLGSTNFAAEQAALETHAGTDHTLKRQQMEKVPENVDEGIETGTRVVTDKKQRIELSENDSDERSWIAPLRFLVRKVLSVSDVGALGRIVLPKEDAEGQLPQIDTKEGKLLDMEDYNISRRWSFRFKWWINSKSRMYVLENTGEFIRHHCLKENDSFFVYEDGYGKLVVRGQKKTVLHSDSAFDPSKQVGSNNAENPANLNRPSATPRLKMIEAIASLSPPRSQLLLRLD